VCDGSVCVYLCFTTSPVLILGRIAVNLGKNCIIYNSVLIPEFPEPFWGSW